MASSSSSPTIVRSPYPFPLNSNNRILLDIGGVHYSTTLETLRSVPHSYFDNMFNEDAFGAPEKDPLTNRYFVDRNGQLFGYLLDFMRMRATGATPQCRGGGKENLEFPLPKDESLKRKILVEADFFGLDLLTSTEELESTRREKRRLIDNGVDEDDVVDNVRPIHLQLPENLLNDLNTGGYARAIEIGGLSGATVYNPGTLNGQVHSGWVNNGMLLDEPVKSLVGGDPITMSYRSMPDCGTTWVNEQPGHSIGVLIVDLGRVVPISRLFVYSMISDGNVSHVRVYWHGTTLPTLAAPSVNDTDWNLGLDWTPVSLFLPQLSDEGDDGGYGTVHPHPTIIQCSIPTTRYLRIEAKCDDQEDFIEVRQIKAYAE